MRYLVLLLGLMTARLSAQSLEPPVLLCATNNLSGDVTLEWSVPDNPCGPFIGYEVWASLLVEGPYNLLATVSPESETSFTHTGADGITTTWHYYLVPVYDCPGFDAPTSDTLDNRDPQPPVIDYVTVVDEQAQLFWNPGPSPETTAYIIYRQITGFTPIDTVYGRFSNSYIDAGADVGNRAETYSIASLDSCQTLGLFANPAHTTVLLQAELDRCGAWVLSWSAYGGWDPGPEGYEVRSSVNGAFETLVSSLGPDARAFNLSVNDGDSVCATVVARRADGTRARSNTLCRVIEKVQPSRFVYWRTASMISDTEASLSWYPDPLADGSTWRVESGEQPGPWLVRASGPFPLFDPDLLNHTDVDTRAGRYYRALTVDSCGAIVPSNVARTMRLRGEAGFGLSNTLQWNELEIPNSTLNSYTLYRRDDGSLVPLVTLSAAATTYTDDVSALLDGDGIFCYRVEAEYQLELPELGISETLLSLSNEHCVEQIGKVFVPNAIVPGGSNPVFKPIILFGEAGSYTLQVFSRYGGLVFESNDPELGWDGTLDGEPAPGGSYGYVLRFSTVNGQEVVKKGNVTVVR
jgi:gliding motility-associated-like protein